MRRLLQDALLWFYRLVFAKGLLRYPWGRRLFFVAYDIYKKVLEAGDVEALRHYISEGSLVVDVGANVGFFSMRFASWVGERGRVIAIEPEPRNFAELQRRVHANGYVGRIDTHCAVADQSEGEVRLVVNEDHPGDHKIGDEGVAVRALTVDGLCSVSEKPVAFIKIDVQGAEMRVLAGATVVLEKHRPALFVEVDEGALSRFGTSTAELLAFLSKFGYVPYEIDRNGVGALSPPMIDALIARKGYTDILFIAE